jgi:hypothetical protein
MLKAQVMLTMTHRDLRMTLVFSMASNCQPYRFYYQSAAAVLPAAAPKKKAFCKEATLKNQIVLTSNSPQGDPNSPWFRFP